MCTVSGQGREGGKEGRRHLVEMVDSPESVGQPDESVWQMVWLWQPM